MCCLCGKRVLAYTVLASCVATLDAHCAFLRRSKLSIFIFSFLSFSGGHPHNWNAINKECLSLLTDLTHRLIAYHDTVATNGRAKSLSTGSERKTSSETSGTLLQWLVSEDLWIFVKNRHLQKNNFFLYLYFM